MSIQLLPTAAASPAAGTAGVPTARRAEGPDHFGTALAAAHRDQDGRDAATNVRAERADVAERPDRAEPSRGDVRSERPDPADRTDGVHREDRAPVAEDRAGATPSGAPGEASGTTAPDAVPATARPPVLPSAVDAQLVPPMVTVAAIVQAAAAALLSPASGLAPAVLVTTVDATPSAPEAAAASTGTSAAAKATTGTLAAAAPAPTTAGPVARLAAGATPLPPTAPGAVAPGPVAPDAASSDASAQPAAGAPAPSTIPAPAPVTSASVAPVPVGAPGPAAIPPTPSAVHRAVASPTTATASPTAHGAAPAPAAPALPAGLTWTAVADGSAVAPAVSAVPGHVAAALAAAPAQGQVAATAVPTASAAAAPVVVPSIADQLAVRLASLRTAPLGEHVMTMRVDPESIGPVRVVAHIATDGVRIELFGGTDHAREALRSALPDLRRDLASTGLSADLDLAGSSRQNGGRGDGAGTREPGLRAGVPTQAHRATPATTAPALAGRSGSLDLDL